MRKEFSLKNYFVYVVRYIIVVAVIAVVGFGAGLFYGMVKDRQDTVRYQGNLAVVGISEFYGSDVTQGQAAAYATVRDNVLNAMLASDLRTRLYDEVKEEWMSVAGYKSSTAAQKAFFNTFSAWRSNFYVYVQMKFEFDSSDDPQYRDRLGEFSVKVIDRYIEIAADNAYKIEGVVTDGGDDNKIIVTNARAVLPDIKDSLGLLKSMAFGLAGGIILGLAVMLVLYIFDGRITSYGDIAELTGKRLLGVNNSGEGGNLYSNIDCAVIGGGSLLVCGGQKVCRKIAEGYARYVLGTGRTALLLDCDRSENGEGADGLGEYMRGKPLGECVKTEDGLSVLYGGGSWQAMLANSDKLGGKALGCDVVVISASYSGDGKLNVLSSVCDKLMVAVDQKTMKEKTVLALMHETQFSDKVIGAAIENTGKSFVGGGVYVAPADEEVQ